MKIHVVGVRLNPEVKSALERAAEADQRPLSTLMAKIVTDWSRDNGWLLGPKRPVVVTKRKGRR